MDFSLNHILSNDETNKIESETQRAIESKVNALLKNCSTEAVLWKSLVSEREIEIKQREEEIDKNGETMLELRTINNKLSLKCSKLQNELDGVKRSLDAEKKDCEEREKRLDESECLHFEEMKNFRKQYDEWTKGLRER